MKKRYLLLALLTVLCVSAFKKKEVKGKIQNTIKVVNVKGNLMLEITDLQGVRYLNSLTIGKETLLPQLNDGKKGIYIASKQKKVGPDWRFNPDDYIFDGSGENCDVGSSKYKIVEEDGALVMYFRYSPENTEWFKLESDVNCISNVDGGTNAYFTCWESESPIPNVLYVGSCQ